MTLWRLSGQCQGRDIRVVLREDPLQCHRNLEAVATEWECIALYVTACVKHVANAVRLY